MKQNHMTKFQIMKQQQNELVLKKLRLTRKLMETCEQIKSLGVKLNELEELINEE